ncbi:MAG TPA: allophanate hydrolase subunit 2 family protein, partial [Streptosporangiaceae bacterium]|nr:allophanate hydrolase subunit 2 family protein [Streptosporangiaceae bacterium]
RRHTAELPSEPVVTGAVEVPPDGHPLIFLNDHPTTAGYPVIAVVVPDDLASCAQARPGTAVRLRVLPSLRD